jgi:hypothetical protein
VWPENLEGGGEGGSKEIHELRWDTQSAKLLTGVGQAGGEYGWIKKGSRKEELAAVLYLMRRSSEECGVALDNAA